MSDCQMARNRNQVRRRQRALYLKSEQEETCRFYSLYDKLWREEVLWEAWRQVRENKGTPGVDEVAIDQIVAQNREDEMMGRIQRRLREQAYSLFSGATGRNTEAERWETSAGDGDGRRSGCANGDDDRHRTDL